MPGVLSAAAPVGVLPNSLSTSFVETAVFPLLTTSYHDGNIERSLILDGVNPATVIRTWKLSKRLTASQLSTLLTFWEVTTLGGLRSFYFYDPFAVEPPGSNYDSSGGNATGRNTVYFRGDWSHQIDLGRGNVPNLEMVSVA